MSTQNYASIVAIREFRQTHSREVFSSKSGGKLHVDFALPFELVRGFFAYDEGKLKTVPKDIRGLRGYSVVDVPKGGTGGCSFHKVREEAVFGISGSVRLTCEDLYGGRKSFIITQKNGIVMPPYLLQSFKSLEAGSGVMGVANTLYPVPADPLTNDTFSEEEFRELQKSIQS